jgi:hypothetical protein
MTSATIEREPNTPSAFGDWISKSFDSQTDKLAPTAFICFAADVQTGDYPPLFSHMQNSTWTSKNEAFSALPMIDVAKDLKYYAKVADLLFPGIRQLTPSENKNLRSYYRKLYRKA